MLRRSIAAAASAAAGTRYRAAFSTLEAAPALVYSEHGDPEKVLTFVEDAGAGNAIAGDRRSSSSASASTSSSSSSSPSVLVRWLASPVNWSDVNVVEGTYPGAPAPPATPGNEGAGIVERVFGDDGGGRHREGGRHHHRLAPGDLVVPLVPAAGALGGTWRRFSVAFPWDLHRIDPSLGLSAEQAATLCINPPTALHLLEDFVALEPGQSLIQTGATTAVGKLVVQLARSRGVATINVVRDRASAEELSDVKRELVELGGGDPSSTVVASESEVAGKRSVRELASSLKLPSSPPAPLLGLNCVGGAAASSAMRLLSDGATFVTYGGLSRKPLAVPASALIFRDIRVVGYWLSKGLQKGSLEDDEGKERCGDEEGGSGREEDGSGRKEDGSGGEGDASGTSARSEGRGARLAARRADLDRVASLVSEGTISTLVERVPLRDWRDAVAALRRGGVGAKKQVLVP